MKTYLLLGFCSFIGLFLDSCTNHGQEVSIATSSASHSSEHNGRFFDSIRDPYLKAEVTKDSVELIAVLHDTLYGKNVEHILFLDHHFAPYAECSDPNKKYRSERDANYPLPDSMSLIPNPLPELNGCYLSVFRYHGQYMMSDVSDDMRSSTSKVIVADSAVIWSFMMPDILLYVSVESNGNYNRLILSDKPHDRDTIEIKKVGGNLDLSIWKWNRQGDNDKYLLRVPASSARLLPTIKERNTMGEDATMTVSFDKINYDSLWAVSK